MRKALTLPSGQPMVQIITGFLGKGVHTGAITTLGRGGSDLTATLIGAALDLAEVQVCIACATEGGVQDNVQGFGRVPIHQAVEAAN